MTEICFLTVLEAVSPNSECQRGWFLLKTLGGGVEGTSLAVKWLRLCASIAGGAGLIPGWGAKIPKPAGCGQIHKSVNFKNK